MNNSVPSYRVTLDDLPDLDSKTREALRPLLESLNDTLQRLVQLAQPVTSVITPLSTFTADAAGAAYATIRNPLLVTPECVQVANFFREDDLPIDVAYGFWWTPVTVGIKVLFSDLEPGTTYSFSTRVQ